MAGRRSIARAAGFLMVATLIARLLGYVRDMIIYSWFNLSYVTDAYNAAFSIPDFIYALLVGGALSSAFIPVFKGYLTRHEDDEAWKVASIVFNYMISVLFILIILAAVYTPALIRLLVPKLPAESINLAVFLTRIMLVQTFFMALNGIALGILNSREHFTTPAIGSILYNAGVILMGVLLGRQWGITAFAVGVVVGSALSFMVQVPALARAGVRYHFSFDAGNPGFREIIALMIPVVVGLSVTQLNLLVNQNLASGLSEGSISALRLAQRLMMLPLGIFGTSIAMAAFPSLAGQATRGEMQEYRRTLSLGLRGIFLVTIPAGLGLMALREPIIQLLFQHGAFTVSATQATAQALFFYAAGIFAYSSLQVLNRAFYALKDTTTPVVIGVITIAVNIMLSIWLVQPLDHRGLALAYSLSGLVNMLLLFAALRHRVGGGLTVRAFYAAF